MSEEMFDFEDGNGPVPAVRWPNGGGWVAKTANVALSVYVGPNARVFGNAKVRGNAQVSGNAVVSGDAQVSGDARVYGDAWASGDTEVSGGVWVSGEARVSKPTTVSIDGLAYQVTITETHLIAGCQSHSHQAWREFTQEQIEDMDGTRATAFYPFLLKILDLFAKEKS